MDKLGRTSLKIFSNSGASRLVACRLKFFAFSSSASTAWIDTTMLSVSSRRQIISVAWRVQRVTLRGKWKPVSESKTLDFPAL